MMKRNGLVFVPPESPKRVILYPTQDSTNHPQPSAQQQQPIVNGFQSRPKTALITNSQNDPTTSINANNNARLLQPHPHSSPPKPSEKTHADEGSNAASRNPSQRTVNPYYANPFFRPKILTNQSGTTTNPSLAPTSNRESTVITTTVPLQQQQPTTTNPIVNGTRSMIYPKPATSNSLNNGRLVDSDSTFATAPSNQEESRRWAHSVAPTSIAQRVLNDERPNTTMHSSTNNITNAANGETGMHKHTSATDIVISLMDPLRPPLNTPGASVMNILARRVTIKDDSAIPETSATTTANNGTTTASPPANNQNWRKALLANFQKNSRNIPTSKIFQTKHNPPAVAPPPTNANDPSVTQPTRPERSMILNNNNSERTFQASDTAPPIPFLMRKSTESLRVTKQETANATNSNNHSTMNSTMNATIERSTSLQVPMSSVTNGTTDATLSASNTAETVKPKESSNPEPTSHPTISIPSALITGKPTVSVEQQRAIITRVMIRRDFVKSTESKPPMPSSANPRLMMTTQANRANGLPSNETNQLNANGDTRNASPAMANPVRMYQSNQNQIHLSQKSLLQFNPVHSAMRESMRVDHPYPHPSHAQQQSAQQFQHQQLQQQPQQPQQQSSPQVNQSVTRERISSASTARVPLAQTGSVNPAGFRSISLSATNAEMKRKKEELFNKVKKRAASASAVSNDGTLEKDPFEIEDEEYEAELEEESVRSSESDVENDASVSLDPAVLLSDKTRRLGNAEVKPGFIPSLFSNVPPTIRFCTENQRIEQLPAPLRKMMKWKMSSITPNIVKNTVIRSGFRLISGDEGNDWLGTWSRHMKPVCFKAIREYQKVNHFPGSFQIGRKDRLWRNLSHMQAVHSRREFDFVPQTFVLPADFLLFKRVFDEITDAKESKWIIKPPASARGQGIRVISKIEHVPKKRPVIVQKYIANPYLINGHKFDLRLYVYVTSHDPLRIYLFDDGLTRFASRKYSSSVKSLSDRFMHLTNYSINRYNSEYRTNNDSGACTGHKWSLKALWTYLKKRDLDVAEILERIKDLIIKTIISADAYVNVLTKANVRRKYSVHELFGFDVILDEHCKPYIVEVNISPSLHSNSPLDISVKGAMICDLLNLSGFMIPDRRDILFDGSARRKPKLPKSLIFDRRVLPQALSSDEKLKHQYFTQRYHDEQARRNILDVLTPDDLRILIETEDEFARRGSFERIFPTHQTRKYLKYFETPRYYNLLLNEWIAKYHRMEERGIALLNSYCKKGIHLQHPATDNNHIWAQYQKLQGHLSHRDNDNTNGNGS